MYKTYFFLEGNPGTDPFRLKGADAAAAIAGAIPVAGGYTQTRTLVEQITERGEAPFIGIAELWFASATDALDSVAQADALAGLLAPGARIGPITTGRARTVLRLAAHHDGGLMKGVFPFRRKEGMTVAEFQRYWWLNHGPIAALTEHALYYLQCHPLNETYAKGRPPYDGITELHWTNTDNAKAAMASRQMTEDQSNDAKNFVEQGSVLLFLAEEEVVVAA